jgi:hypothetical protein
MRRVGRKETADLSTSLRSGRDDKFVARRDSVFPGEVRGTADPSAALGTTKETATLPWKAVAGRKAFFITVVGLRPTTTPVAMTSLWLCNDSFSMENRLQLRNKFVISTGA